MKAVSVEEVPSGTWRLELKFDGFRAIAVLNDGQVELWSRNHLSLAEGFPEVTAAVAKLRCLNAVLDGEIVALDEAGRSHFQLLQNRGRAGTGPPVVFYVFDLLHLDGVSLLGEPIETRQALLKKLLTATSSVLRLSPVFDVSPADLLARVRAEGGEGIIAKQAGSIYQPDRRSPAWLKCKVFGQQEFVIGGFTPPRNSRTHFGAILVGYYEGGRLRYAGKVGSGFDQARLTSLMREFQRRRRADCPFNDLPSPRRPRFGTGMTAAVMRDVTWIEPELVAQVRFAEWTREGLLRQPVFLGLRDDKRAHDVRREAGPVKD